MHGIDIEDSQEPRRPRTLTVVGALALAAAVFSWLAAYAVPNALAAAELMSPVRPDNDPRPFRMSVIFLSTLLLLMLAGGTFRWVSHRQLKRIDAMEEAE